MAILFLPEFLPQIHWEVMVISVLHFVGDVWPEGVNPGFNKLMHYLLDYGDFTYTIFHLHLPLSYNFVPYFKVYYNFLWLA